MAGRASGLFGVGIAALAGRAVFGAASFGASTSSAAVRVALALMLKLAMDADDRLVFHTLMASDFGHLLTLPKLATGSIGELLSQPFDRNHGCVVAEVAARVVQEVCAQVLQQ